LIYQISKSQNKFNQSISIHFLKAQ